MNTLIENNKLIAEFMGWNIDNPSTLPTNLHQEEKTQGFWELKFDSDWNWLMEVVDKIERNGYWVDYTNGDVFIYDDNYNLIIPNPMHENKDTKLSIHYKIVIEFINWYNNN
jgi:hypothetical protein